MCVCLQIGARDAEVSKLGSYGLGVGLLPVRGKVTGNYRKLLEFPVTLTPRITQITALLGEVIGNYRKLTEFPVTLLPFWAK